LPRLEQTRAFVLETLRLFPTSLGALRRTGRPAELGGVSVPPERLVLISYWTTQRDRRYWPEPTRFELGRWLGGGEREHGGVYLPFSAGHRRCPARSLSMTMLTLVVATLAKAWEAEPLRASVSLGVVPFIHPRGGLRARLKSRRAG
jgi:cytochrome P450